MAKTKKEISVSPPKMRIIQAATVLFAEQGYQGTTISDISRKAGISEGGIYEYFRGKEELLLTIPDEWVKKAHQELEAHLFGIEGALNKLRKFLWWYLRYVERTDLNAKIVYLHLKTNRSFLKSPVYENVRRFFHILVDIIAEGQERGEIRRDIDPYVARALILGVVEHNVIRWLVKEQSYSLFDNLEQFYMMLRDALTGPALFGGELPEYNSERR